jgi:methylase of polypeptide subunit release factors
MPTESGDGGQRYVPALRFHALTALFDPVVRMTLREQEFKNRLLDQANPRPGQRILDVGCGTGTLTLLVKERVPEAEVVGLDADPEILERAGAKAREAASRSTLTGPWLASFRMKTSRWTSSCRRSSSIT